MTTIAIMQPYLFPYLGYFQLIQAVEHFILLDDVHFIKRGWIHRNRILWQGAPLLFTWPLAHISQNRLINQHQFCHFEKTQQHWCQLIRRAYAKAPYFNSVFSLLQEIGSVAQTGLVPFIHRSLQAISHFLEIKVPFYLSSECDIDKTLRGEARILALCHFFGATRYINLSGGLGLYQPVHFEKQQVQLQFIQMEDIVYPQGGTPFVPALSIVDVLMFNPPEKRANFLAAYTLT